MFRTLTKAVAQAAGANQEPSIANAILTTNPLQLSRWLDEVWSAGGIGAEEWAAILIKTSPALQAIVDRSRFPAALLAEFHSGIEPTFGAPDAIAIQNWQDKAGPLTGNGGLPPAIWRHLLYSYLVESTGLFEILAEVVRRFVVGESLPIASTPTLMWVRSTEQLFFRDPPLFSAGGAFSSQLRPDARVNRRNAYWRMFGLDLPHPPPGGMRETQPWKRDTGPAGNTNFLEIWNELLRQVWLGYENDSNSSGANPTDDSYIGYLCQTLSQLLQLRRQNGLLAPEEFACGTLFSWLHLTVEYDTPLVKDLAATAGDFGNPADRLLAIGARVGIAPSRQARELFELADKISPFMWAIEIGLFNEPAAARLLYKHKNLLPDVSDNISSQMLRIIDLWQSATGERVKDLAVTQRRVQAPARPAQPTKLLPPGVRASAVPPASTNGNPVPAGR